jgi:hypothetical protein
MGEAMKRRIACVVMALGGLAGCCADEERERQQDLTGLEEIRIDYTHLGWGSSEEYFTITPSADASEFVLQGRYETHRGRMVEVDQRVAAGKIGDFIGHLESDAWTRVKGIHALSQRLDRRALRDSVPEIRFSGSRCSPEELRLLARRHLGRNAIVELVDTHYAHRISWTDDYPTTVVQVRWRGKPTFVMSSQSQKALMLPWDAGEPADTPPASGENWSVPVSLSLQALLPPASQAFQRLDGISPMEYTMLGTDVMLMANKQCDALRKP